MSRPSVVSAEGGEGGENEVGWMDGEGGGVDIFTCSAVEGEVPAAQHHEIDFLLFRLDLVAHFVHVGEQAHIAGDEVISPRRVQILQLLGDARAGRFAPPDKVDGRAVCVLDEVLEGALADAAGGADKDGDGAGECGADVGVGGADITDLDHVCWWIVDAYFALEERVEVQWTERCGGQTVVG